MHRSRRSCEAHSSNLKDTWSTEIVSRFLITKLQEKAVVGTIVSYNENMWKPDNCISPKRSEAKVVLELGAGCGLVRALLSIPIVL